MDWKVIPFENRFLSQLDKLPPPEWRSNAYHLFMDNDWQPWFKPFQVIDKNKLLGFGMIFHFDDVAWLGWILVDSKHRKQGVGTSISKHLINECDLLGATKIILTATELGTPIYKKLGFEISSNYIFLSVPDNYKPKYDKIKIRSAKIIDLKAIYNLDFEATGEKRGALLEYHLESTFVYEDNQIEGFFIQSLGDGLIIAKSCSAGEQLVNYRIRKKKNVVAIPEGNEFLLTNLKVQGFKKRVIIPRMVLGSETNWKQEMIFNRSSGYCG